METVWHIVAVVLGVVGVASAVYVGVIGGFSSAVRPPRKPKPKPS